MRTIDTRGFCFKRISPKKRKGMVVSKKFDGFIPRIVVDNLHDNIAIVVSAHRTPAWGRGTVNEPDNHFRTLFKSLCCSDNGQHPSGR